MSADPFSAYWLALRGAALAGVTERNVPAAPPGMPEALVEVFSRGNGAQRVLTGAGILWPLLQDCAPRTVHVPPAIARKTSSPDVEALLGEILDDPGSVHWPEKRVRLALEWLRLAEQARIQAPGWHLPALLDLALGNRKLAETLQKVLTKEQRQIMELRDNWRQLSRPSRSDGGSRKLSDILVDSDLPLEERREALDLLLTHPDSAISTKISALARRCFRAHRDLPGDEDVLALDPGLHADWLPAVLLPELPTGLVPRDTYLRRAFAVLSLAPVENWVRPKSRGRLLCGHFLERVMDSMYPEGLVWAFGKSVLRYGPRRHVEDLVGLYCMEEYAWILEKMGALSCLRQDAPWLLPGEKKDLGSLLSQSKGKGIGTPIMDAILHMEPLDLTFFHRAVREVFKSIQQSPEGALTTALEHLALVVEPVPEDSLTDIAEAAAESPATAAAWTRAHSLLLFRRRMKQVFSLKGNSGPRKAK